MCIIRWKKPMWKGYLLYEVNYVIFQKRKNYGDSKKVSKNNCQRLVSEKGENRKNTEDFRPQWWIHLSKPIESTMPRVSHNTNCGLWVMMHDCRFICGNKGTTLVRDVASERGIVYIWKSISDNCMLSTQFCWEPNISPKLKSIL